MIASATQDRSRPDRMVRESPIEPAMLVMTAIGMTILPYVVVSTNRDVWQFGATLAFVDFVQFGLGILGLGRFLKRMQERELHSVEWAGVAFLGALLATFAIHPSMRGFVLVARIVSCLAIASVLLTTSARNRLTFVRWLGIAVIAQCLVAVTQRVTVSSVGLGFLGETESPFRSGYPVPSGTMRDSYVLAGFGLFVATLFGICIVQRWIGGRLPWLVLVAAGVLTGLSGSRAALLTLGLIVCSLLIAGARRGVLVGAVMVWGFLACAAPSHQLWMGRAHVVTSKGTDDVTNGRSSLTEQALGLIRRNPFVGVGPGNYSTAVRAIPELARKSPQGGILPVHNMALLAVSEGGVLVALPMLFVFAGAAVAGLRNRGRWLPLLAAILPFLMLDLVFWFYPEGLLMLAIALAFVLKGSLVDSDGLRVAEPNMAESPLVEVALPA